MYKIGWHIATLFIGFSGGLITAMFIFRKHIQTIKVSKIKQKGGEDNDLNTTIEQNKPKRKRLRSLLKNK